MPRHIHYQKRYSSLIIAVVLVILGIVGTIGWYSNHYRNSQPTVQARHPIYHKPANPVSAAADSYIIDRVGQDRFMQYFKYAPVKALNPAAGSALSAPADSAVGGIRSYHFSLLKSVTPDNDTIIIIVNLKNRALTIANLIPDCRQDKSYCDFKVTRNQAMEIAKKRGFNLADLKLSWEKPNQSAPGLTLKLSSCTVGKVMFIDYRNGKVLDFHADPTLCPPPNPLLKAPHAAR